MAAPPFPQIIFARFLKRRFKIPLVLDFRDAWSINPYREKSIVGKMVRRFLSPLVENLVFREVDLLVNVCDSAEREYLKRYPFLSGRTAMIPNGFDEADFAGIAAEPAGHVFTLLFTGSFGLAARKPDTLFDAMKLIARKNLPIRLRIVGDASERLVRARREAGLEQYVELCPLVPHSEAIREMFRANVLIAYVEKSSSTVSPIGAKTYEYLRTGRPVLRIGPSEDLANLTAKYAMDSRWVETECVDSIADAIISLYENWQSGSLKNDTAIYNEYTRNYNREYLASKLASRFNALVD